jgi:DNA adenine methylase
MDNPLRYPGSKADFLSALHGILKGSDHYGLPMVEPYAGSAAISLGLLELSAVPKATIIERDPLLFAFWSCVFEHTERLINRFLDLPISLNTWKELQPLLSTKTPSSRNLLELGVAGLFFNRTNFSGIIHSGPIGGMSQASEYKIDCRTNKADIIARIARISELHRFVTVKFGDGLEQIKKDAKRNNVFYYVDPPYFLEGERLYRHYFSHKDHKTLASVLNRVRFPWVLSYDTHHVIEFFYGDRHMRRHSFLYSAKSSKRRSELVIANFDLPENLLNSPAKHQRFTNASSERKRV